MKQHLLTILMATAAWAGCTPSGGSMPDAETDSEVATSQNPPETELSDVETLWAAAVEPDAARADLAALYDGLKSGHFNLFENRTQAEYDALYKEIDAQLAQGDVTRLDLFRSLQRFAAFGNVAHARIDFPAELWSAYRDRGGRALMLFPKIDGDRVVIATDDTGYEIPLEGARLIAIDGTPVGTWLDRMEAYISADTRAIAMSLIEFTFPRDLWLLTGERQRHDVTVELADGTTRTFTVPTTAPAGDEADQSSDSSEDDASELRDFKLLTGDVGYLKPGPFYGAETPSTPWDPSEFVVFVDEAFTMFLDEGVETLILDLRNNPGGDNSFSDPMIAWFAPEPFRFYSEFLIRSSDEAQASNAARLEQTGATEGPSVEFARLYDETPRGETFSFELDYAQPREGARFDGEVYALINRNSYSNAVNVAAILQDRGWATIVGEPTTDFATTLGSMESFTLPESGFEVGFPKALIVRPNGDRTPGPVMPDVSVKTSLSDGTSDPVLDELVRRVTE